MCVAIVQKPGEIIREQDLRNCFSTNPDGAGFAYIDPDGGKKGKPKIEIKKGFFDFDDLRKALYPAINQYGADSPFLIHCRIATSGKVDEPNCHPFRVRGGALIHNGVMGAGLGPKSDTRVFVDKYQNSLTKKFVTENEVELSNALGWNKVAMMFTDGSFVLLNRNQWTWEKNTKGEDAIAFSNMSWRPYTYTGGYNSYYRRGERRATDLSNYHNDRWRHGGWD